MFNLNKQNLKGWTQKLALTSCLKLILILVFGLSFGLALPTNTSAQSNEVLTAPTVLSPPAGMIVTDKQPIFTGVTYNETKVDVYIDGIFNGRARVKNGPTGVASWSYRAFLPLSFDQHEVFVVARSEDEILRSPESILVKFDVEPPFSVPTLLDPLVDDRTTYTQPWIRGLAKNGSIIDIYIDGRLNGTVQVENDPSGTTHFEYLPSPELIPGWHALKIQAKDARGKPSDFSPALVFETRSSDSKITDTAPQIVVAPRAAVTEIIAPTLLDPKTGTVTTKDKPTITGVAISGHSLEVFVDGSLNGELDLQTDPSGVYGFTYQPFLDLQPGVHTVNVRSIDESGDKSGLSNSLSFLVRSPSQRLVISPTGVTDTRLVQKSSGTVAATSTKEVTEAVSEKSKKFDSTAAESTAEDSGAVSSSNEVVVTEPKKNKEVTEKENQQDNGPLADTLQQPAVKPMKALDSVTEPNGGIDTDIVVISDRSTTTAETRTDSGNTVLVVVLAIAAIIIIGLISWYTSRDDDDQDSGIQNSSDDPTSDIPPTDDDTGQAWEEEAIEVPAPPQSTTNDRVENADSNEEFPLPPPPPALEI